MPNTTVRAAAEGMPTINRRSILGGLAAATALVAADHAYPAENPDAELLVLDKEMEAAHAKMERAGRRCSRADKKASAMLPPRPLQWNHPDMPEDVAAAFDAMTIKDVMHNKAPIYVAWNKEVGEQKAANKALWDEYRATRDELYRTSGADDAQAAFDACCDELWEIGRRIFAIPANTFEGMAVKLRTGDRLELEAFADDNEALVSISADIKRLAQDSVS